MPHEMLGVVQRSIREPARTGDRAGRLHAIERDACR